MPLCRLAGEPSTAASAAHFDLSGRRTSQEQQQDDGDSSYMMCAAINQQHFEGGPGSDIGTAAAGAAAAAESITTTVSGVNGYYAKPSRPKGTRPPRRPRSEGPCATSTTRLLLVGRDVGNKKRSSTAMMGDNNNALYYGRSSKSCARHMVMRAGTSSAEEVGPFHEEANKAAATAGETEKIHKAVRQAKAQVARLVNAAVARKEAALGLARKRYRRLEADMVRSRVELVDTLSEMEREEEKHAGELESVEKRAAEVEAALRNADEVLGKLTSENKRKRLDIEQQEKLWRARVSKLERRLEHSGREQLSTWGTVRREVERAASRERYRMTAFLQRYVLENEFLRATRRDIEEASSELRQRARRLEDELAKPPSATTAVPDGRGQAARDSPSPNSDLKGTGSPCALPDLPGEYSGPRVPPPSVHGGQSIDGNRSILSPSFSPEQGQADLSGAARSASTQAEMAIQRLKRRIEGSLSANGSRDGGGKRSSGNSARRGEVRSGLGRVAELSSLLAETESERDSLAALLVMAEKRMERMTLAQEELALKLAWESASTSQQQQKQKQQKAMFLHGNSVTGDVTVGSESAATASETASLKRLASLTAESAVARSTSVIDDARRDAAVAPPHAMPEAAVENAELRRRVRHLEALNSATEMAAREIEGENRRLRSRWWPSFSTSPPILSSGLRGGATPVSFDAAEGPISRDSPGGDPGCRDLSRSDSDGSRYSCEVGIDGEGGTKDISSAQFPFPSPSPEGAEGGIGARAAQAGCILETRPPVGRSGAEFSTDKGRLSTSGALAATGGRRPLSLPSPSTQRCWERSPQSEQRTCPTMREEDNEAGFLLRTQLAWVLGLPAVSTTEHELLAEVMHLVAERGSARTDASILEAQLAEMDIQSLSLTRLAAGITVAPTQDARRSNQSPDSDAFFYNSVYLGKNNESLIPSFFFDEGNVGACAAAAGAQVLHAEDNSGRYVQGADVSGGGGRGCGTGAAEGRNTPGGRIAGTAGASSVSRNAQSDDSTAEAVTAAGRTSSIRHAAAGGSSSADRPNRANHSSSSADVCGGLTARHPVERARGPAGVATGPAVMKEGTKQTRKNHERHPEVATAKQDKAAVTAAAAAVAGSRSPVFADDGSAVSQSKGGVGMGPATGGNADSGGSVAVDGGDNPSRASFPRIFQGRPVSLDIFFTKIHHTPSSAAADANSEAEGDHASSSSNNNVAILEDDAEFEIRVEAYDPGVLRRHALTIHEGDIQRCFSARPNLYTLGAHRRSVHKSLADRLVFMSEDDVRAALRSQSGAGGEGAGRMEKLSAAAASRTGPEPNQLLVLMGDAEEIILVEEGGTDADRTATTESGRNKVNRFAKNTISQIKKEEEIVEGVAFQHEPAPVHDERGPETEDLARAMVTMESEHSYQDDDDGEGDHDSEYDEEEDNFNDGEGDAGKDADSEG